MNIPLEPAGANTAATADKPCLQIQIDLSAMVDGELDAASVRRVMVHAHACPACRGFLDGIRTQLRLHHDLVGLGVDLGDDELSAGSTNASGSAAAVRKQLMQNRHQLARILYELGRGYVLMGLSPSFSRVVAREPVPIPDMFQCGQNLVDEVDRLTAGAAGAEWVRAKELFGDAGMMSPAENMRKGKRLLVEALMLNEEFHEARIYLGHAYHVGNQPEHARREFALVLDVASDPVTRAFALENMGNVFLEQGDPRGSIRFFQELVDSGVIVNEPRFFTSYFNLALAHGLLGELAEFHQWLSRLYLGFPHKRRLVGAEMRARTRFAAMLDSHPDIHDGLAEEFPEWFPLVGENSPS